MIRLNCPSCGGQLTLPNSIGIAFCTFCGTKIVLNTTETAREQQKLGRYHELRDVAVKAKNHKEVIEYCNRILEIDPGDVDSWITKAVTMCGLSTEENDGWQEAVEYLRTAKRLAPTDERIAQTYNDLAQQKARWYLKLAGEKTKLSASVLRVGLDASQYTIQSVDYTLKSLKYIPDFLPALEELEIMVQTGSNVLGIHWGEDVHFQLQVLAHLRAKKNAESKLAQLRAELSQQQTNLAKLKASTGFFSASKIKSAEERIRKIQTKISACKKVACYEPPKTQL